MNTLNNLLTFQVRAQDSIEELAVKLKQSSMVEQDDMKASFAKVSLNNLLTPLINNLFTYHDMEPEAVGLALALP